MRLAYGMRYSNCVAEKRMGPVGTAMDFDLSAGKGGFEGSRDVYHERCHSC